MTVITDEYLTLMRACLDGNDDVMGRLSDSLAARDGDNRVIRVVVALETTALFSLLWRRFSRGYRNADIIGLVARVRTTILGAPDDLDPATAEQLVYGLLGNATAVEAMRTASEERQEAMAGYMPALLRVVLEQGGITGDTLDDFLGYIRPVAEMWLTSPRLPGQS